MKILLTLGTTVIFISVFFILFIISAPIKNFVACLSENWPTTTVCQAVSWPFMIGLIIIGIFVIMDVIITYLIFSAIKSSESNIL